MYEGSLSAVSNRATWADCVGVIDNDTGEPLDISGASEIAVQVAPMQSVDVGGYGNVSYSATPLLTATLSNGKIQHVQTGVFAFEFSKGDMRGIAGGVYNVEVTIEKDGETVSLILGTVPVREGVVTL